VGIEANRKSGKFNKSRFITKTVKQKPYEAALLMSRRTGIQESNTVPFTHSSPTFHKSAKCPFLYTHSKEQVIG